MIRKNHDHGKMIYLLVLLSLFLMSACATLPEDFDKPTSYAYESTKDTRVAKAYAKESTYHPGKTGFAMTECVKFFNSPLCLGMALLLYCKCLLLT